MSESLEQKANEEVTINDSETVTSENSGTEVTEINDKGTKETTETTNNEIKKKSKKPLIIALSSVLLVIVIVGVVLLIVFNSKSAEAKRVDSLISSIGTVTLDSEKKIAEAEKEVKALSKEDYNQLDNVGKLEEARKTYEDLALQSKADDVIAQIDEIGEVTIDSKSKIEAARNAYDKAEESVKEKVSNYEKLTTAESKYNEVVNAHYASQAASVIGLINDIGSVTEKSEEKITKAEKAYNELSLEAKEKVTNYDLLKSAREEYDSLVKDQKRKALKEKLDNELTALNKTTDSVTGYSWYYSYNEPKYVNERVYILPHIGNTHKNDDWYLCLVTNYYGTDWIFYDKLVINADGKLYYKDIDYSKVDRSVKNGQVAEFCNQVLLDSDAEWLKAIAESSNAVVRFQGSKHDYDLTVSESDKQAIKQILDIYSIAKEYKELR